MTFAPSPEQPIGTINSILSKDILRSIDNDGDHTYLNIQEESKTQLPITSEAMNITVPLTNPNICVTCFDKSFITLKVSVKFNVATTPTISSATNIAKAVRYFIGLKHSSEAIGEYSIYHKGKQVSGTLQSNATAESFLYHVYRSEDELTNRRGIYTKADAAAKMDLSSICGKFVSLYDLNGATSITIPFTITIPFNDILCFQQFTDYPAALFGALELRFKFNKNAFVFLQCNPKECLKKYMCNHNIVSTSTGYTELTNALSTTPDHLAYDKEFSQVGDQNFLITGVSYASNAVTYTLGYQNFTPDTIQITECYTTMCGYRISPERIEGLRSKFESEPWVKFSQNINYLPFSTSASSSQLFVNQQTYLNNTTDFILTFPRTQHEITVLKNPMLQDLSLTVMNRKYPEMSLDTSSERFAQLMLSASDTYMMTPNREYVQSISMFRTDDDGTVTPNEDLTSFVCTLKVERPSAMGMICDGLDSKGEQVSVRLTAKPKYPGGTDQYCAASPPPPVLYTVNDSFFIFNSRDGGQCIYSDKDFNEVVTSFM